MQSGQIVVETNRGTYRTTLRRERELVRAEARSVTPVETGSLLALGIPGLRGTSASNGKSAGGVPGGSGPPSAADLLPLVQDQVDRRLGDLEAWIVRHHLLSRDPAERSAVRRARVLERFFETLKALTPGVDFEFGGVDAETGDVLLDTPDGRIGLGLLSQGMSSMLAFVGVLLQRLSEVNNDAHESREGAALLLVDELDAHLHPWWQWRILPLLRERFPRVQIIATTHSPLIVAQSQPGELVHIHREAHGLVADHLERPFAGWRSDQILTHPLFGLDTTMDQDTATALERYRELLGRPQRQRRDHDELIELAERLGERLPAPEETQEERDASRLLREFLDWRFQQRIEAFSPEERKRIAEEAQLELIRSFGEQ
jgi:hypothetical protein